MPFGAICDIVSLIGQAAWSGELAVLEKTYREQKANFAQDKKAAEDLLTVGESPHPKDLDAVELGLRTQASQAWSFDATLFWHRLADDIGAAVPDTAPTFVATPVPHLELAMLGQTYDVRLRGFEAAADWRPAPGWRHQIGLSRLDVTGPADAATTGLDRQLYATPKWLAQWRSVIDLAAGWRLDARVRHVGQRGERGGRDRHPQVLADLGVQAQVRQVLRVQPLQLLALEVGHHLAALRRRADQALAGAHHLLLDGIELTLRFGIGAEGLLDSRRAGDVEILDDRKLLDLVERKGLEVLA